MSKITVVDYGGGNLKSVANILKFLECEYEITDNKKDIENAEKIILPGQGHFGQVMTSLNEKNITEVLIEKIESGTFFLGICVGIQLLFDESEEAPGIKGLGVLPGKVVRFTEGKIPQIGWNQLKITRCNSVLTNDYVYFVNSYHVVPEEDYTVSAYSNYHRDFVAAVERRNVFAFQFHPEKSGEIGYDYIKRWIVRSESL